MPQHCCSSCCCACHTHDISQGNTGDADEDDRNVVNDNDNGELMTMVTLETLYLL